MARSKKQGNSRRVEVQDEMAHNPFADQFAGLLSSASEPEQAQAKAPAPSPPAQESPRFGAKLILRREKKGRGGKTVTRIEGVQGSPEVLDALARKLGKALGARAFVQDGSLWVSGDQCQSARRWFEGAGAPKVVIGN